MKLSRSSAAAVRASSASCRFAAARAFASGPPHSGRGGVIPLAALRSSV